VITALAMALISGTGQRQGQVIAGPARPQAPSEAARDHSRGPAPDAEQLQAVARLASHGLPLFCGGSERPMVALTFDDGPGPYSDLAVRKLRQAGLRATFFIVGKQLALWPGRLAAERTVGTFGDHTYNHLDLPTLPAAAITNEIVGDRGLVQSTGGEPVVLFRPPYGAISAAVRAVVKAQHMLTVLWSVDSADSLGANYLGIERNVIRGLRPGAIILMHENHGQTIRALPGIFAALKRRHLQAVTLPQLIASDPPSPAQLRRGWSACGTGRRRGNGG
jgi:peptidoglycan/xylan/chitin deacetylase (PgdA/CDA1 family)